LLQHFGLADPLRVIGVRLAEMQRHAINLDFFEHISAAASDESNPTDLNDYTFIRPLVAVEPAAAKLESLANFPVAAIPSAVWPTQLETHDHFASAAGVWRVRDNFDVRFRTKKTKRACHK
jgi:hypothetical protein